MPDSHIPFIANMARSLTGQKLNYASKRNAGLQMLTRNDTDAIHRHTLTIVYTLPDIRPSYNMLATSMQADGYE